MLKYSLGHGRPAGISCQQTISTLIIVYVWYCEYMLRHQHCGYEIELNKLKPSFIDSDNHLSRQKGQNFVSPLEYPLK